MRDFNKLQVLFSDYFYSGRDLFELEENLLKKGFVLKNQNQMPYSLNDLFVNLGMREFDFFDYDGKGLSKYESGFLDSLNNNHWFFNDLDYVEFLLMGKDQILTFKLYKNTSIPWPENLKDYSYIRVRFVRSLESKQLFLSLDNLELLIKKHYKPAYFINSFFWQYHSNKGTVNPSEFEGLIKERCEFLNIDYNLFINNNFDQSKIYSLLKDRHIYANNNDLLYYKLLKKYIWNDSFKRLPMRSFKSFLNKEYKKNLKYMKTLEKKYQK